MEQGKPETKYCDGCRNLDWQKDECVLKPFDGQYKPWCCAYQTPEPPKKWVSSDVSRPLASVFNMTYLLREY